MFIVGKFDELSMQNFGGKSIFLNEALITIILNHSQRWQCCQFKENFNLKINFPFLLCTRLVNKIILNFNAIKFWYIRVGDPFFAPFQYFQLPIALFPSFYFVFYTKWQTTIFSLTQHTCNAYNTRRLVIGVRANNTHIIVAFIYYLFVCAWLASVRNKNTVIIRICHCSNCVVIYIFINYWCGEAAQRVASAITLPCRSFIFIIIIYYATIFYS